jgi:hypothetical protein
VLVEGSDRLKNLRLSPLVQPQSKKSYHLHDLFRKTAIERDSFDCSDMKYLIRNINFKICYFLSVK